MAAAEMASTGCVRASGNASLKRARGFSLIEILAVLVIIGVVSAVAILSMHALDSRSDQGEIAERLAGMIQLASENARLENTQYGLRIEPQHYEFMRFTSAGWAPVGNDPALAAHDLPDGMTASVRVQNPIRIPAPASAAAAATSTANAAGPGNADQALTPQIAILSTGEMTPFTLRLAARDGTTYIVRGGQAGRVHVVPPGSSAPAAATD